jgi:hypothetical protein
MQYLDHVRSQMQIGHRNVLCMKFRNLAIVIIAALASAGVVNADELAVTSSQASSEHPSYSLSALTNGAGLTGTGHNVNYLDMWMGYGGISQDVTFGFGTTKGVESIEIWNYNHPGSLERGVNNFNVLASTDGSNFSIVDNFDLSIGTGVDGLTSETFTLSSITNASNIRIESVSTHGNTNYVGLSEVKIFGGDPVVPEPHTLLLASLASMGLTLRRRRSARG